MTSPPLFLPAAWLWHLKQRSSRRATAFSAKSSEAAERAAPDEANRQADRLSSRKDIGGDTLYEGFRLRLQAAAVGS